jgi:DNA-binding NtrC family response regulator
MEAIKVIDTQESQVLVVRPGQAKLEEVERFFIFATLRHTRYNRTKSARLLGIGIRTLQRKLKQYAKASKLSELDHKSMVCAV